MTSAETKTLVSTALPLHPAGRRERILLGGEIPHPSSPPPGCRFHPGCPKAMSQCASQEPEWREVRPGHFTACHLY
jgi:oligopeptide/dipeptide ABC transporter ATP-binding protein